MRASVTRLLAGLRALVAPGRATQDLDDELRAYREALIADRIASGMTPEQAARAARLEMGSFASVKDAARDVGWESRIHDVWRDVRLGARSLGRRPGFALAAVLTLAFGIGPNAAIASVINFILKPLPAPDAQSLIVLGSFRRDESRVRQRLAYPDVQELRTSGTTVFADLAAWDLDEVGLSADGQVDRLIAADVSGNYFPVLGLAPAVGRLIAPADDVVNGPAVVVLTHDFWRRRFNADPAVVGHVVRVDGRPATVIGVGPEGFTGTMRPLRVDAFLPLRVEVPASRLADRDVLSVRVLGRLAPASTLRQAQTFLDATAARFELEHPRTNTGRAARVYPAGLAIFEPQNAGVVRPLVTILALLVFAVLVIAGVNVLGLTLARMLQRQKEFAVRAALGASRWRLVRLCLIESGIVASASVVLGGVFGMFLAGRLAARASQAAPGVPILVDLAPDWRVFGYLAAMLAASVAIVGLLPAIRASHVQPSADLIGGHGTTGAPFKQRLRTLLVVGQIALSVALLAVSGLFVRSIANVNRLDLGFDSARVLLASIDPSAAGHDDARGRTIFDRMETDLRSLPGITHVAQSTFVPFGNSAASAWITSDNQVPTSQTGMLADHDFVTASYFDVLGMRVLSGDTFRPSDRPNTPPVAVINQAMADRLWPGANAIGQRFRDSRSPAASIEVIGIVSNGAFRKEDVYGAVRPRYFLSLEQAPQATRVFNIRVANGEPDARAADVLAVLRRIDAATPISDLHSLAYQVGFGSNGFGGLRGMATVSGALGLFATLLALVGTYGVVSFTIGQRVREVAIRAALGARRGELVGLLLRQSLASTVVAVFIGLVIVAILARYMSAWFFGVSPIDVPTFAVAAVVVLAASAAACYVPVRRVTRMDVLSVLRAE